MKRYVAYVKNGSGQVEVDYQSNHNKNSKQNRKDAMKACKQKLSMREIVILDVERKYWK